MATKADHMSSGDCPVLIPPDTKANSMNKSRTLRLDK
ncbi:hypothetical protein DSL72_008526 [Monilinia vaccinii-corymbosi]|uniref:Uncharacterized protein n=1 Tax=Monilinia vaccinii-corymbosi TaxID=61207 RepID=A0A8A3PLA2_9HELO|nr:hypothetical protein DSL72_008526 [Monilinia vaccinii-corymbosi]